MSVQGGSLMGKTDVRRDSVVRLLREKGTISVSDIVQQFSCSEATARRDLEILESEKKLIRTFGGAILEDTKTEIPFFAKLENLVEEKNEIAGKALELIENGDIIALTGGSTTHFIAKKLRNKKKVTVVTNAINIAYELTGAEGIQVIVTGGVSRESFELSGPMADAALSKLAIQKLFIGADGISLPQGIMTFNELEANTNRLMIERSLQNYVVLDHTKFSKNAPFVIVDFKEIDAIITDSGVNPSVHKQYCQADIKII